MSLRRIAAKIASMEEGVPCSIDQISEVGKLHSTDSMTGEEGVCFSVRGSINGKSFYINSLEVPTKHAVDSFFDRLNTSGIAKCLVDELRLMGLLGVATEEDLMGCVDAFCSSIENKRTCDRIINMALSGTDRDRYPHDPRADDSMYMEGL